MALAWLIMAAGTGGTFGLAALISGVLLLDIGMQAQHITNQSILLSTRTAQAGRVTIVYMGTNVIAGAVGSALATRLCPLGGWVSLCVVGFGCGTVALVILGATQRELAEAARARAIRLIGRPRSSVDVIACGCDRKASPLAGRQLPAVQFPPSSG